MIGSCAFELAERGRLPDALIRLGIRSMLRQRLAEQGAGGPEQQSHRQQEFVQKLRNSPIAIAGDAANVQHYEVPAEFFQLILGARLKYSCCYFGGATTPLEIAEQSMLALTCERAAIEDGMNVLELGCGWGSLTLWMAERYPRCRIGAMSNSAGQKAFIESECGRRGFDNVRIVTADVNEFRPEGEFDRVVSVEMFEHVRNYPELMRRIASWLTPQGKLFVHIFCHRSFAYPYEPSGPNDWMAREFFTGGTMPSDDLLLRFQDSLLLEHQWRISGMHYRRTLEAWLERLDSARLRAEQILSEGHSPIDAARQVQRWRLFLMACSELFGYREGTEWWVSQYLFGRRETA